MAHTITITEEQRQMIILALAQLSLDRPGWHWTLGEASKCFPGGEGTFENFREINGDTVPASKVAHACAKIIENQMVHCAKMLARNKSDSIDKEQAGRFVQAALQGACNEIRQHAVDLEVAQDRRAT